MKSLDERIDGVCWRIATRLSAGATRPDKPGDSGIVEYFDLHTKLSNIASFHRDFIRLQNGDEETVLRALCFMEEAVLTPYAADRGVDWVYFSLHILLSIANPHRRLGREAVPFLNDIADGIRKWHDLADENDSDEFE